MADWLALRPRFAYSDERVDVEAIAKAKQAQQDGTVVVAGMPGGFDLIRQLMGDEEACLSYYTQPELVQDILDTAGDTCVKVFERVGEHLAIDQLSVHEDMAGNGAVSRFRGFDIDEEDCDTSSCECSSCPGSCEIAGLSPEGSA